MLLSPPKRFSIPKEGNLPEENEDDAEAVFSVKTNGQLTGAAVAVSDGASESAFSSLWATTLAHAFVERPPDLTDDQFPSEDWLEPSQEFWESAIPWERIPWHGEAKARQGALATLVGVTFAPTPAYGLSWRAVAVGDSCLFVVRQDDLALSFPLDSPDDFNNNPTLICSNPANNQGLGENALHMAGECVSGDWFILASDALSRWLLERYAAGEKPWQALLDVHSSGEFSDWVGERRRDHSMRNDDTTMITLQVH